MKNLKALKTNSKAVKASVRNHILNDFDHSPRSLFIQSSGMQRHRMNVQPWTPLARNDYETFQRMVEGAAFLVSYYDVKNFLNGLGINPEGKEYTDEKAWNLYIHLIARECCDIVAEFQKSKPEYIATYCLSNTGGVGIVSINDDEGVTFDVVTDHIIASWISNVEYVEDVDGDLNDEGQRDLVPVFKWGEMQIRLDECIRL